jgi:cysteine-rich repeat protein
MSEHRVSFGALRLGSVRLSHITGYLAAGALVASAALGLGACASEETRPRGPGGPGPTTTSTGGGGAGGEAGAGGNGGAGGTTAQTGGGGAGGGPPMPMPEDCFDGKDNDLDGKTDCADADCTMSCASPCAAPKKVAPSPELLLAGDTSGHGKLGGTSCAAQGAMPGPGSAHVYAVDIKKSGMLDATLTSLPAGLDLTLSFRHECATASDEFACSERALDTTTRPPFEYLSETAVMGDPVYVVVEGFSALHKGAYELVLTNREITCGDGKSDPPEACDDGNTMGGDGCSPLCELESDEPAEPANDVPAGAGPIAMLGSETVGSIAAATDVDWFKLVIPEDNYSLRVEVLDMGNGQCSLGLIDPQVELYGPDDPGKLVKGDDDGGDALCPRLDLLGMKKGTTGTYYLRVSRSLKGLSSFAYKIFLELDKCGVGSGVIGASEECDDGNNTPGDGCSPICAKE